MLESLPAHRQQRSSDGINPASGQTIDHHPAMKAQRVSVRQGTWLCANPVGKRQSRCIEKMDMHITHLAAMVKGSETE